MNCVACGAPVPEGASFCPNCGTRQIAVEPQPIEAAAAVGQPVEPVVEQMVEFVESVVEPVVEPVVEQAPAAASTAEPAFAAAPVAVPVAVPNTAAAPEPAPVAPSAPTPAPVQPQPVTPAQPQQVSQSIPQLQPAATAQGSYQGAAQSSFQPRPAYAKGCVASAVDDIKGQPGALKKMMFLGLVGCVPILNFVVTGYAINWSREVPFGAKSPLPHKVVNGQNFEMGFYAFLVALVCGLVAGVTAGLIALIPILGWIASIVIALGVSVYQYLAYMRIGMLQQLGEGFKIQLLWNVMQRDWKSLLCAALVPSLVVGLVVSIAVTVLSLFAAGTGAAAALMMDGGVGGGILAGTMGLLTMVLFVLVYVVALAASAIAIVVTMRALGHWIARYAPEWTNDAWAASRYGQAPPQTPVS